MNLLPPLWVLLAMAAFGLAVVVLALNYFPLVAVGGLALVGLGLASGFAR